jgi:hypothetical protein
MKYLALLVETVSCSIYGENPFHSNYKFGEKKCVIIIRHKVEEVHELVFFVAFMSFLSVMVTLSFLFSLHFCYFGSLVVSVLATGPMVRGFQPGRGRWILRVIKFVARLPSEGK